MARMVVEIEVEDLDKRLKILEYIIDNSDYQKDVTYEHDKAVKFYRDNYKSEEVIPFDLPRSILEKDPFDPPMLSEYYKY